MKQSQEAENFLLDAEEECTTWPPLEPLRDNQGAVGEASGLPITHEANCSRAAASTVITTARDTEDEERSTAGHSSLDGTPRPPSMEPTTSTNAKASAGGKETIEEATSDKKMAEGSPATLVKSTEEEEEEEIMLQTSSTSSKSGGVDGEGVVLYQVVELVGDSQSDSSDSEGGGKGTPEDIAISVGASPYFMIADVPHSPRGLLSRDPAELALTSPGTYGGNGRLEVDQDVPGE